MTLVNGPLTNRSDARLVGQRRRARRPIKPARQAVRCGTRHVGALSGGERIGEEPRRQDSGGVRATKWRAMRSRSRLHERYNATTTTWTPSPRASPFATHHPLSSASCATRPPECLACPCPCSSCCSTYSCLAPPRLRPSALCLACPADLSGRSRKGGPARQRWTPLPRKPRRHRGSWAGGGAAACSSPKTNTQKRTTRDEHPETSTQKPRDEHP